MTSLEELARLSAHHSWGHEEQPTKIKITSTMRLRAFAQLGATQRQSAQSIRDLRNETAEGAGRMWMIIAHSFHSLRDTFEARASEWALTGVLLSMALVFLLNDAFFYKEHFSGLRDIANSRGFWAAILTFVGLTRLSVLVINGSYYRTPHWRSATAFLSAGVWFLLFMGFLRNGSIMAAIAPWIFLLDAYNSKRAGREAGMSEFIQRHVKKRGVENAGLAHGAR
jgi:hypothetical protein